LTRTDNYTVLYQPRKTTAKCAHKHCENCRAMITVFEEKYGNRLMYDICLSSVTGDTNLRAHTHTHLAASNVLWSVDSICSQDKSASVFV